MPSSTSASPAAWANILDTIDQALTLALVESAERQGALPLSAPSAPPTSSAWQKHLEQCDAHLEQLQACVRQADAEAAEVDSALEAGEGAWRDWLAAAAVLIQGSDPLDQLPPPGPG